MRVRSLLYLSQFVSSSFPLWALLSDIQFETNDDFNDIIAVMKHELQSRNVYLIFNYLASNSAYGWIPISSWQDIVLVSCLPRQDSAIVRQCQVTLVSH